MRAKLVPATAIDDDGEGGRRLRRLRHLARHDAGRTPTCWRCRTRTASSSCPGSPRSPGSPATSMMDGKPVEQNPRQVLKRVIAEAATHGYELKTGVECEYLPDLAGRQRDLRRRRHAGQALLRPAGADAPLRRHRRDLRRHAGARLGPVPERPRGRQRPVRDELGLRRRADDRRPARLLQVHGQVDRREARAARDLHAQAVRQPHRQRLPRARLAVATRTGKNVFDDAKGELGLSPAGLPLHRRRHALGRGAVRDHQPDGELLQAHQRAADAVGRDLVAEHRHLRRQQPHPHDPHSRCRPLRAAARRRRRQSVSAAGRRARRRARRHRATSAIRASASTSTCTPRATR